MASSVFSEKAAMVPWKAATLPRCIATEILWNKKVFPRLNCRNETFTFLAYWTECFHCNWNEMVCYRDNRLFSLLPIRRRLRHSPALWIESERYEEWARVSLTVASQSRHLPELHGISVRLSGLSPFSTPPLST